MVSLDRRRWRIREEVPREFREHRSLEWSFRGMSHFYRICASTLCSELLTEIIGVRVQEDCVWIADPKALNHILHKSGYLYAKPNSTQEQTELLADRSVISVEGELSITIRCFLLLAHLPNPQATYTSVSRGRWPRRSDPSRLKVCYRISRIPLPRHANFVSIRS